MILPRPSLRSSFQSGFTLLELTIVLFIMLLFLGAAAMSFSGISEEEKLRKPAAELQKMARQAVQRAGMYEETEAIVFEKNGFGIRFREDPQVTKAPRVWFTHVELGQGITLRVKRWGQRDWKSAAGQRWVMQPSGLCEPIMVRLETERSFLEMQFNPITGGVADERMTIASH